MSCLPIPSPRHLLLTANKLTWTDFLLGLDDSLITEAQPNTQCSAPTESTAKGMCVCV